MSLTIRIRQNGYVTVVDLGGRIALGEATGQVRDTLRELIEKGNDKILLNLKDVSYIDSAGLGELISGYTTVTNRGGQLKLMNLTGRVNDLMQITKLTTIFEIFTNEKIAVLSYS